MSKKAVEPKSQEVTGCVSRCIEGNYVLFPSKLKHLTPQLAITYHPSAVHIKENLSRDMCAAYTNRFGRAPAAVEVPPPFPLL